MLVTLRDYRFNNMNIGNMKNKYRYTLYSYFQTPLISDSFLPHVIIKFGYNALSLVERECSMRV